jgi:uncharacterized protein (DUF39 family)
MIVFLKNTVAQINIETQKGEAPVVRAQQASASTAAKHTPRGVDAVTSGTQGISHYFAAQGQIRLSTPDSDDT